MSGAHMVVVGFIGQRWAPTVFGPFLDYAEAAVFADTYKEQFRAHEDLSGVELKVEVVTVSVPTAYGIRMDVDAAREAVTW